MQSNNHKEDKRRAMSLVNKLYELAELPVSFRQSINDKADEIVIEHVHSERESAAKEARKDTKSQIESVLKKFKEAYHFDKDFLRELNKIEPDLLAALPKDN